MRKKYDNNLQEIKETRTFATNTTNEFGIDGANCLGFTCDVCGRKTQGTTIVNGMKFCAKCYQETFGNNEIAELKRQLAEKDKYIDELEQEREFMLDEVKNRGTCGLCEKLEEKAINVLRDKLKEKDKEVLKWKDGTMICNYEKMLAEKDKEIEYLKRKWAITKDCLKRKEEELPHHDKMLSHQICEKIREFIEQPENSIFYDESLYVETEGLRKLLDKLEKGEENENHTRR